LVSKFIKEIKFDQNFAEKGRSGMVIVLFSAEHVVETKRGSFHPAMNHRRNVYYSSFNTRLLCSIYHFL